jgi:hypothetical protein
MHLTIAEVMKMVNLLSFIGGVLLTALVVGVVCMILLTKSDM